ncbi:hypothetical protein [Halalkalibacterium ligniniphilum]|uniref:hypothetical protein n=1 Tax=Halalkalibacterium ligniniphilum TaxID=1134413 RepID=UPI00034A7A0A|nr:hypothetical protein [Halalkalibacterium ligniniphilum]
MDRKQARKELQDILSQNSVRVSRLKRVIEAIGIEQLIKQNVEQAKKIQRQTERLKQLEQREIR